MLNDAIRISSLAAPDGVAINPFESGADPQSLLAHADRPRELVLVVGAGAVEDDDAVAVESPDLGDA